MKLIKLEVQGLNSFVDKNIVDFQSLFKKGIFGIFGATGSGKSSILDAVFLALYGKVLRSKNENEFINMQTKRAKVRLSFEMREDGVDKIFEVSRDYLIGKMGQVIKKANLSIINGSEKILLASKDSAVTAKINEIIGFGDEEFQRFIALPQGQFSKFLKDTSKNKIDTIAKLFGLDGYGDKLALKLQYEINDNEKRKQYLRGVLEQYVDIDEGTIKEQEKELEELVQKSKVIAKNYGEVKNKLLETEKVLSLINEKSEIDLRLKKLKLMERKYEQDYFKLNILKTTFALAPKYIKLNSLKQEKVDLESRKSALDDQITATSNAYFQTVSANDENKTNLMIKLAEGERRHSLLLAVRQDAERYQGLEKEKANLERAIEKQGKKLNILKSIYNDNALTLENNLKILKNLEEGASFAPVPQNVLEATKKLTLIKGQKDVYSLLKNDAEKELLLLQNKKQKLVEDLLSNDAKLNKYRTQVSQVSKTIKELFGNDDSVEEALERSARELENLKIKGRLYLENADSLMELKKEGTNILKTIKEEKEIVQNIEKDTKNVEEKIKVLSGEIHDLEFLKNKAYNENLIDFLRSDVEEGQPCPICNSIVKEKVATQNKKQENFNLSIIEKQQEIDKLQNLKNELFVSLTQSTQNLMFLNEQRDIILNKVASLTKKQAEFESENPLFKTLGDESLNIKVSRLEEVVLKIQTLLKSLNKIRDNTYSKERICVVISANIEEISRQEIAMKEKIASLNEIIDGLNSKEKEFDELQKNGVLEDAENFARFSENQNLILTQQKALIPQIIKFVETKEKSSLEYFNFLAFYNQNVQKLEQLKIDMQNIVKKLRDLNIKGYVKDEIATNLSSIEGIRSQLSQMNDAENELVKEETKLKLEKASIIASIMVKNKEVESAQEEFNSELDLAQLTEEDLKNEVVYEDITELEKSVKQYRDELDDAKDDLARVEKMLNGKTATDAEFKSYQKEVKEIESEYIEVYSNVKLLQKQIDINKENVNKLSYFKSEYASVCEKENNLAQIAKLNEGNAILKFITEEYILNITEKANSYFATLTNGRYQLLFDEDFVVVDNINGGATRSVGTLSGGETFLASLSVAISIVETLSALRDKPLDFVFLDEGFGTLDENSIEMVMNSIRNLRNTNLVFGLITHEELVKFKTSSRIEVFKSPKNGSHIEIIL